MDDLISREAVIQARPEYLNEKIEGDSFEDTIYRTGRASGWNNAIGAYLASIKGLSSARKKGKWRDYSADGYVECPFCDHATTCNDDIDELHFCFWCGAEMRGKDND